MTPEEWCARVDRLEPVSNAEEAAAVADPPPTVVLVGAVNSAKTSLLRRLLIDCELPVPDWAVVSAREETSVTNSVEVLGCRLVDTPGLEALSQWHTGETTQALLGADALVLLTTSNLFASDSTDDEAVQALSVASGDLFAKNGLAYPKEALAVLVTRFDEAGLDPTDFPQDYAAARQRKLEELAGLLGRHAPHAAGRSYLDVVAPDPFGRTRNRTADRHEYDPYRSWDGISEFSTWLGSLPARVSDLRQWTAVRRRAAALTRRDAELTAALAQEVQGSADARAAHAESVRLAERCGREKAAVSERLSAALDKALYSAPQLDDPRFRAELSRHIQEQLRRWADDTVLVLEELAGQAQTALPDLDLGDAATAAERLAGGVYVPSNLREHADNARAVIEIVRAALAKIAPEPSDDPLGGATEAEPLFGWLTPERVVALNLVMELASVLIQAGEQVESHRAQQLQWHRDRLAEEGQKLARMMFTSQATPAGWEGIFEYLQQAADDSARLAEAVAQASSVRSADLSDRLAEVQKLLDSCPQP